MADNRQSSAAARYVLTVAGRQALVEPKSCECLLRWQGLILECPLCGTVYTVYGVDQRDARAGR